MKFKILSIIALSFYLYGSSGDDYEDTSHSSNSSSSAAYKKQVSKPAEIYTLEEVIQMQSRSATPKLNLISEHLPIIFESARDLVSTMNTITINALRSECVLRGIMHYYPQHPIKRSCIEEKIEPEIEIALYSQSEFIKLYESYGYDMAPIKEWWGNFKQHQANIAMLAFSDGISLHDILIEYHKEYKKKLYKIILSKIAQKIAPFI